MDNRLDAHFRGTARLVRRPPPQPGGLPRHRRRDGQVPREAHPGKEERPGPPPPPARRSPRGTGLEFIDTGFENASPLWYEAGPDGSSGAPALRPRTVLPNRAAGHIHFRLHARARHQAHPGVPESRQRLERPAGLGRRRAEGRGRLRRTVGVATVPTGAASRGPRAAGGHDARPASSTSPASSPIASPTSMRGSPRSPRARSSRSRRSARPSRDATWRSSGSAPRGALPGLPPGAGTPVGAWRQLGGPGPGRPSARRRRRGEAVSRAVLRVRAADGQQGRRRARPDAVQPRGKDLNRNWDRPADPELARRTTRWRLARRDDPAGMRPQLALELHNDGGGKLHISRPPVADLDRHLARMRTFEALLREHTWFTEGSTTASSGTRGPSAKAGWNATASMRPSTS